VAYSSQPDCEVWRRWRQLVNMTPAELRRFMDSSAGRQAGLSVAQARQQGIRSGQESARWLLKMMPTGTSFSRAVSSWTPAMWQWARRQVSFISRMRAGQGPLYTKDGRPSRRHLSLLIWGHSPQHRLRDVPPC